MTEEEKAALDKEAGTAMGEESAGDKTDAAPAPQQQSISEGAHADSLQPPHPNASEEEKAKHRKLTEEQKAKLREVEAQSEKEKEEVSKDKSKHLARH